MVRLASFVCGLALASTACTSAEGPPPTAPVIPPPPTLPSGPQADARPGAAPSAAEVEDPRQWACTKDGDCSQTCALGAVSRTWLADHRDADTCDDGCGWRSGSIACRDGECVTLTDDGDIDENCTKRSPPRIR